MKLLVLGATGGVGLHMVRIAIARGHDVTALVRKPNGLQSFGEKLRIVTGDLLKQEELVAAMQGHDGVLSGFGPRVPIAKDDHDLLTRFAKELTGAMQRTTVKRAVIISTAFLFKDSIFPPTYFLGRLLFPSVVADSAVMEKLVQASDLQWTLVRPPQLTDKPAAGRYRVKEGHLPFAGFKIARPDVAEFMVNCIEQRKTSRKIFGVCN